MNRTHNKIISENIKYGLGEGDDIDDLYDKPFSYDEVFQDHLEEQIQKSIANMFQKNGVEFTNRILIQIENDIGDLARKSSQLFKQTKRRM